MARLLAVLALCLHALLAGAADATVAIPPLKARVTDLTATLGAAQMAQLESRLAAFEARKGSQVVVLLLPSTQPEAIEQFAIRLMEAWKIGRKGVDDGAILIVAKDDRRLRIEVGYGLEGALNDATAKRIIAETITPRFKAGDLPGGIAAGVDAILAVVEGEILPAAPGTQGTQSAQGSTGSGVNIDDNAYFPMALVLAAIGGAILRFFLGNLRGAGVVGGLAAGAGWWATGTVLGALAGAAIGFFVALFGLDLLLSGIFGGGRSGGGGGFSGGGGSGGGGGASGSW